MQMKDADYWNVFELTGSINDYLNYACASEAHQEIRKEEGERADEARNGIRNGFISYACRRV